MRIKFFPILTSILFIIFFLIFFKGLKNSNTYTPNFNEEKKIPSFTSKLFGTTTEIESKEIFVGSDYYLLNIWASWCVPCRYEHEYLVLLNQEANLKIVGLNYKDNIENAKLFLQELNNPYDILISDQSGLIAIEWGAYGVPETFLIYNNEIIKKYIGPLNQEFVEEINLLIK